MGLFSPTPCAGVSTTSQSPTFIVVTRENAIRSVSKPPSTRVADYCGKACCSRINRANPSARVGVTTASLGLIQRRKKSQKNKRRTESAVDVVGDKNATCDDNKRISESVLVAHDFAKDFQRPPRSKSNTPYPVRLNTRRSVQRSRKVNYAERIKT